MPVPLQKKLDRIKENFDKKTPPEVLEVMRRATDELARSGIGEKALHQGDEAPAFELPRVGGGTRSLTDLLKHGPLVLTFYRGHW